jgi:hypothetical protein
MGIGLAVGRSLADLWRGVRRRALDAEATDRVGAGRGNLIQINSLEAADGTVARRRDKDRRAPMNLVRFTKRAVAVIAAAIVLAGATLPAQADNGKVRIRITKAGFIIGVGGGEGVLHFKGRNYPFRVSGISGGTIGVAHMDLIGTAFNLQRPTDIAGSYTAGSASIAVVGGAKVARVQNANGVVLELHGAQVGLELSLNIGGATITMQ